MTKTLEVVRLGRIGYNDAIARMEALLADRLEGRAPDTLLLLEHPPVLTLGRKADRSNVVAAPELLRERGIEVVQTTRGGDVTYHGPGQIVAYPVLDLRPDRCDVRAYVKDLEEVMIRTCAHYGVTAGRVESSIGTWIEGKRKIGAVGVRLQHWCTSHGLAFNVSTRLDDFDLIVPCGIRDKEVTSLSRELGGKELGLDEVLGVLERCFREVFW